MSSWQREPERKTPLLLAVEARDKNRVRQLLQSGADVGVSESPMDDPLYFSILTSQYEIASLILSQLTAFRDIILQHTPLDRDATTIILEYYGNVHDQIGFGWSKMCQLGWINSLSDLKLLQLLILHGPRSVVHRTSPDFGEHCLVSAIRNNCQLMLRIVLAIFARELGPDLYGSISSDLQLGLRYHIDRIRSEQHRLDITRIFEEYHDRLDELQSECLAMILSDQFGKYRALKTYVSQRTELFPILESKAFKALVKIKSKESQERFKEHVTSLHFTSLERFKEHVAQIKEQKIKENDERQQYTESSPPPEESKTFSERCSVL